MAHNTATAPTALARFVVARLQEDCALAEVFGDARQAALLDARIEVVRLYTQFLAGEMTTHDQARDGGLIDGLEFAVELVAMEYADHPDFDEEWCP